MLLWVLKYITILGKQNVKPVFFFSPLNVYSHFLSVTECYMRAYMHIHLSTIE